MVVTDVISIPSIEVGTFFIRGKITGSTERSGDAWVFLSVGGQWRSNPGPYGGLCYFNSLEEAELYLINNGWPSLYGYNKSIGEWGEEGKVINEDLP